MAEAFKTDKDPIYEESIKENIEVISKQENEIKFLQDQLDKLHAPEQGIYL